MGVSKADFDSMASSYLYWEAAARSLLRASEVIEKKHQSAVLGYQQAAVSEGRDANDWVANMDDPNLGLLGVAWFLLGAAVENVLKATVLVLEGPPGGEDDKHDLIALAARVKLALDDRQMLVLKKATEYIYWRSRYPAPVLSQRANQKLRPSTDAGLSELRSIYQVAAGALEAAVQADRESRDWT